MVPYSTLSSRTATTFGLQYFPQSSPRSLLLAWIVCHALLSLYRKRWLISHFRCLSLAVHDASALGSDGADTSRDGARSSFAMRKMLLDFQNAIGKYVSWFVPALADTCIGKPDGANFPIIAATHGHVIGLGVDMTSACDIRIAASNSIFAIKVRLRPP